KAGPEGGASYPKYSELGDALTTTAGLIRANIGVKAVAVDLGGGLIGAAASADHLRCRPRRRLRPSGSGHKSPHRSRGVKRWGDSRRQQQ
ncbi:MAG: hypothetical protein ABWX71_03485, partial [Aeromicrobium sp.]